MSAHQQHPSSRPNIPVEESLDKHRSIDLERISGCRYRRLSARVVTCCDWLTRLTLRFPLNCWDSQLAQPPGLSQAGRCPLTTAAPSTALVMIQPAFTDAERLALAGFLAGYRGLTREAYALDLREFTTWCRARSLNLFAVRRAGIESFARDLEARGRARTTVTGDCAPSRGSASTPSKRSSSSTHPPRMSAVRGWTTSPMPSPLTATSSAPCW